MFVKLFESKKELHSIFQQNKVVVAYVFGSAITDAFNEESDVDFLVKFPDNLQPLAKGELWWNLHDSLRTYLNREIDIITESSLKNPYFIEEIEKTKQLIYAQQD
ncbi:MAG: nucleotidyltransferase domain-containing protein [Bacteroidales bacterium]|nr:nucleotidyltransferase domain-containing protein [Bacteroidales bacterium]